MNGKERMVRTEQAIFLHIDYHEAILVYLAFVLSKLSWPGYQQVNRGLLSTLDWLRFDERVATRSLQAPLSFVHLS